MTRFDDVPQETGEWFVLGSGFSQCCCSCGLVHTWEARRKKGRTEVRVFVDTAATNRERKKMKTTIIIEP